MKKIIPFLLLTAMLLNACKSKDSGSNDPRAVMVDFFDHMAKKDIDGATKLATRDSKTTMDMMKKGIEMETKMRDSSAKKDDDAVKEFRNMEIGQATIKGDEASIPIFNKEKQQTIDFPMKKEDGSWKVDFSMATLMKMGMEQAKHGMGDSSMANPDYHIPSEDSIKAGLQKFDSLMKTLDTSKLNKMKDALKELEKLKQH